MNRFRGWWRANFLACEFWLAALLAATFGLWAELCRTWPRVNGQLSGNRSEIYGALAAVFGALLGFTITSVSIVLGYADSDRLAIVRRSKHYPTLWKVFSSANKALALATASALIGLVLDRDADPVRWLLYLNVFATSLAAFRIARCLWVLERVIRLITTASEA